MYCSFLFGRAHHTCLSIVVCQLLLYYSWLSNEGFLFSRLTSSFFAKEEEERIGSVHSCGYQPCRVQKIAAVYNVVLIRACARTRSRSISWQSDSQLADASRLADLGLGTAEHGARRRWHDDGRHCLRDSGERAGDRHRNTDRWVVSLYYL